MIYGLIYYIINEQLISKTDLPQQWGKPSKAGELKYKKGRTIQDLFPFKRQKHFIDYVSHKDLISMHNILSIPCSLSTLLKEESFTGTERQCKQILKSIIDQVEKDFTYSLNKNHFSRILLNQKILFINNTPSSKFPLNFNENSFYCTNIALMADNLISIYNLTMSQSSSEIWKTSRHFRISASVRAHKIKTCRNWTGIGLNKLANSFLKTTDLGMKGNINVKYGHLNEPLAFEKYQELYDDIIVLKAGLIIHHKTPWVCASPDGLVIKNGNIERILEIKCPISCKNKQIIENGVPNLKYLEFVNNKLELKKSNVYYTQVQVLMYCAGLKYCDLFIYNNIKPVLLTINRDEYFLNSLMPKIEYFYFHFYLPKLLI